jgi:hypothetical protein
VDEIHELEQLMDALARGYGVTHDPEILAEIKELGRRLRELENILAEAGKNKLTLEFCSARQIPLIQRHNLLQ